MNNFLFMDYFRNAKILAVVSVISMGGVLLVATMIILVNLLVDLLYGVVNPRIRHKK